LYVLDCKFYNFNFNFILEKENKSQLLVSFKRTAFRYSQEHQAEPQDNT